jgi:hypothetical membrane protein
MIQLRRVSIVAGMCLACVLQIHCMLGRGLSTSEERAKAINIARSLERDPLAADAPAKRQWLLNWIIEVPDIRFKSCVAMLHPEVGNQYRHAAEVNQQITFSAAAFRLEDPDNLRNDAGAYLAGVEGALRVYENLVRSTPDSKLAFLDDLVRERDTGGLADHVAKLVDERCRRTNIELFATLGGTGVALILAWIVGALFGKRRSPSDEVLQGKGSAATGIILERIVLVCAAYYVIVIIALHILEPDFDPRFRFMSEYALGDYGWLMTTTFFVLGLAAFAAAGSLRDVLQSSRIVRTGLGLLAVGALFVCLAGVFKDSIPHLLASVVAIPSFVTAVFVLSWTFGRAAGWQTIYRVSVVIALGMLAAFLSMVADIGMPGLQQRILIFLLLLWLSIAAHTAARVTRRGEQVVA